MFGLPDVKVPKYQAGNFGLWRLVERTTPATLPGYWSTLAMVSNAIVLTREQTVWMSTTPLELESHQPHIAAASGHTVVAGLGMGLYLYNIIQKPDVNKVTVLEMDHEIISAFRYFSHPEKWLNWNKVNLIIGDAREIRLSDPVDFLYVDIWATLGSEEAISDTQSIASKLTPKKVGFWGQELEFIDFCNLEGINVGEINLTHFNLFKQEVNLPLFDLGRKYMWLCALAYQNFVIGGLLTSGELTIADLRAISARSHASWFEY